MNKEDIKMLLPHREDMLLLDEVEAVDKKAYGKKIIVGDEFFLRGHFPDDPVVPGVILCEIMAQSACVLLGDRTKNVTPFFSGLDKVRFKHPVRPGDTFTTECEILREKGPFFFAAGKGYVGSRLCVSAEFSFALMEKYA